MNREEIARELVEAAKEMTALTVYDVAKYMEFALDDMKPFDLMIHSVKARIKDAKEATLDKKVLRNLDRLEKDVKSFEKHGMALKRMFDSLS